MRGLKLMWGLLWPFLWFLAALGAAAFSCPHSFSVLEVTGIGAAAAILTLLAWERLQKGKGLTDRLFWRGKALGCGWLLIPAGISVCITLNGLLILTGLESASGMYDGMAELIYGSAVWEQLLLSCLLIPFAEELVFRELGYGRLREEVGFGAAALITALFFGIYHLRPVQAIYAAGLGLVLAAAYEKCGGFLAAFLVHAVSNLASVAMTLGEENNQLWNRRSAAAVFTVASGLVLFVCLRKILAFDKKTLLQ